MRTSTKLATSITATVLLASAASWGHGRLTSPPPRDVNVADNDAHKAGPCGGVAKGTPSMRYNADASTMNVQWEETINHTGCFVIDVSPSGNDNDFRVLRVIPDNAGVGAKMTNIAMDGGLKCANCTLRMRQIMGADPATCNGNTVTAAGTYYSCADIAITDVDAGTTVTPVDSGISFRADSGTTRTDEDASIAETDGSAAASGTDGGATMGAEVTEDETLPINPGSACAASPVPASGFAGLAALTAVAALAVARAKKKRAL
jgi:hypothetical protein